MKSEIAGILSGKYAKLFARVTSYLTATELFARVTYLTAKIIKNS